MTAREAARRCSAIGERATAGFATTQLHHRVGHDQGVAGEVARTTKLVGRLGGEEYGLILEDCPENRAVKLSNNLRENVAAIPFKAGQQSFSVTCSLGVSRWAQGESADELLKKADIALYQAKADGRNRVCTADQQV